MSMGSGGVTLTTTAAATINSCISGEVLQWFGTSGNISATTAGVIAGGTRLGGAGIDAEINNATSSGTVHITANGNVSVVHAALYPTSLGPRAGTVHRRADLAGLYRRTAATQTHHAAPTP